ncbi:hypothetical protein ABPG77_011073 [Micractinium sp. CCAP 211/92]
MDSRRTSAQLRACVADLQEYFASAASPARRRRFFSRAFAAHILSGLLQQLSGQEAAIAQHKDVLLSLTSGLDAVSAAAASLGQPSLDSLPPGQDLLTFVKDWLLLLGAAAIVARNLLEFVIPHCSSEAEQEQLAMSVTACTGAICAACGRLVQLWRERQSAVASEAASSSVLEMTDESLRLAFDVTVLGLRAVSAASDAGADPAAVATAAALSAQLRPKRVLGWLRCALDAVDWVVSTAGIQQSNCMAALFSLLDSITYAALGLRQALCDEPELLSRLAQLTARVHAALVAASNYWADAAWSDCHERLCLWAYERGYFRFTPQNQQAALLPLLVAGGSMLKGEALLLASLPVQPPAGADADQAVRLAKIWLMAIAMVGCCTGVQCSAASRELSRNHSPTRRRSLLQLVAASAQPILRFVSAAAAGGPAAEGISRAANGLDSISRIFAMWAEGCWAVCHGLRLSGPVGSAEQQQETASTVAGLLGMLLQLLARLPRLAEASGEPVNAHFVLKASAQASALLAYR